MTKAGICGHDEEEGQAVRRTTADAKPLREDEARRVVQEYADNQRGIIKKLSKPTHWISWRPLS